MAVNYLKLNRKINIMKIKMLKEFFYKKKQTTNGTKKYYICGI